MSCAEYRCEKRPRHVVAYGTKLKFDVCCQHYEKAVAGAALTLETAGAYTGFAAGQVVPA